LDTGHPAGPALHVLRAGLLLLLVASGLLRAEATHQSGRATFSNPVISGFAPDPSICRSGEDYYLVNSTFEYFPGIPVYHSRDLVNWTLIGHALDRPDQADLASVKASDGIHASTIRCRQGRFYVITTNNIDGRLVNFVLTADDPAGPWSGPHVIEGAPGIDPSLFFDDDGRVWYTGNRVPPDPEFEGQAEIWLQELNLESMALVGQRHYLWRGCCDGVWAEGPHIYKRDGWYYLLISEGGTSYDHALSIAISERITGPYQSNPRNPVLSHRQLSYDHPITGVGHADLVELPFPVFSPLTGKVELHYPMPIEGTVQSPPKGFEDEFDDPELGLEWNFRRSPEQPFYNLTERPGTLRLRLQPGAIAERARYGFAGIRQQHFRFEALTRMAFSPGAAGEEAGLVVIQNDRSALVATLGDAAGRKTLRLRKILNGSDTTLAETPIADEEIFLRVTGDYLEYRFAWSRDARFWEGLGDAVDGVSLSPAVLGGFNYTGVYLGVYASSNGAPSGNHADFEFFRYRPTADDRDDWFDRQRRSQQP
jgi:alpha-N-arabinofuranosidase